MDRDELLAALDYLNGGIKELERLNANKANLAAQADQLVQMIQNEEANAQRAGSYSAIASQYGTRVASGGAGVLSALGKIVGVVAGLIIWGFFALVATILDVGESAVTISGMGLVLGVIVAFLIIKVSKKGSSIAKNASDRLLNNVVDINNRTVNNAPARISHLRSQYDNIVYNLIPENDAKMIVTYKNYEEVIEAFAPNYRYSRCIDKVIFYIRNMRADTLKEALNMFEQEEFQNRVLDNQELQTLYAAVTAGASLETARNTGRIAENTDKMVTSLENIEQYSAQTAMNTAAIADNTFMAAQSAAYAARKSGESAKYLKSIDSACRGGW